MEQAARRMRRTFDDAMLPCEKCATWTRHEFVEQRKISVLPTFGGRTYEDIYRCSACRTERCWGHGHKAGFVAKRKRDSKERCKADRPKIC